MGLIELILTGADNGWFGDRDWRAIAIVIGGFWPQLIDGSTLPLFDGQRVTMFLSHAFLHGNLIHFLMNGVILLSLGKLVADRVGPAAMLAVFLASAAGGGAVFALLAGKQGPMIGASGAVFGLIGVWQYWEFSIRRARGMTLRPVFSMLLVLLVINIALAVALRGGLAWQAHLGGFMTGAALAPLLNRITRHRLS